ncbi:ArdC family protein [Allosphingosinicella humi]
MEKTSNRRASRKRSGTRSAAPAERPRANLYDDVTRRIIAELEEGRFPWVQPWGKAAVAAPGLPHNAATGRGYSGVNILMLWAAVIADDYPTQGWLTFKQARDLGGMVRKGEHGTAIVYADRFTPEAEKSRAEAAGEGARSVPFLKRFTVFNVAQVDGLPDACHAKPAPPAPSLILPAAQAVIDASDVPFLIGGDRAFYVPTRDTVVVPPPAAFFEPINWHRTALHELTHATGHASRLGRDLAHAFGSEGYAREELVAEMGSAFLCAALGITPTVRHADYLASWLDVLRRDNRAIIRAASHASKAADWLLARPSRPAEAQAVEPQADERMAA